MTQASTDADFSASISCFTNFKCTIIPLIANRNDFF